MTRKFRFEKSRVIDVLLTPAAKATWYRDDVDSALHAAVRMSLYASKPYQVYATEQGWMAVSEEFPEGQCPASLPPDTDYYLVVDGLVATMFQEIFE